VVFFDVVTNVTTQVQVDLETGPGEGGEKRECRFGFLVALDVERTGYEEKRNQRVKEKGEESCNRGVPLFNLA